MSGRSAKRQRTTAMASASVPAINSLPPELLETIFGLLDVGTLCTARLVCAHFRGEASRCLHSVELPLETLRSRPETTLKNFPNLSRVSVFDVDEADLLMLAQSPVAAAVTHLRAVEFFKPVPQRSRNAPGLRLVPLPNLTSLDVRDMFRHMRAYAFPQTLRELSLEPPVTVHTANLVAKLTNLTCLRIGKYNLPDKAHGALTALTALQKLEIRSALSLIPVLAEVPLLTHLQFQVEGGPWLLPSASDVAHLASLARLHRLVHLGITYIGDSWGRHIFSGIAAFTGLRSLDLGLYGCPEHSGFEAVSMTPFSQLTALRLGHDGVEGSFLPRFNLEMLQDLTLSHRVELDGDGVAALRRATGLTQLTVQNDGTRAAPEELGAALSRMSRLRALSWDHSDPAHVTSSLEAVALLTELTRLMLTGPGITTNAAVDVCLGLKKLRVLYLVVPPWLDFPISAPTASDQAIREIFSAIAKLPELREFGVSGRGLEDDVSAWLNAERQAKGWPPWDWSVWPSY